jgi:hypothetical protein
MSGSRGVDIKNNLDIIYPFKIKGGEESVTKKKRVGGIH